MPLPIAHSSFPRLVLATTSAHKVTEISELIRTNHLALALLTRVDFPAAPEVVEDGETFADNARKKAHALAAFTHLPALADDSGICVDALGGLPGVKSARWIEGTDADRTLALLEKLRGITSRNAHYACALCLALPGGPSVDVFGRCEGVIAETPRGRGGFGYDPIFQIEDGRTFAEVTAAEKNARSHRARALAQMVPHLRELTCEAPSGPIKPAGTHSLEDDGA